MEPLAIVILLCVAIFVVVGPVVTWGKVSSMQRRMQEMEREYARLRIRLDRILHRTESSSSVEAPPPVPVESPTPPADSAPAPAPAPVTPPSLPSPPSEPAPEPPEPGTGLSTPPRPPRVDSPRAPGEWERAAKEALAKIWNWIIVGEEHRRPGVPMEYAVATNWLVRAGVLILVAGMAFFLDYSTEQGWLGPRGQVSTALLAGAGVMALGIRLLNKRYHLLAQGFLGAGLATWYVTVYAAHMTYELIGAGSAFAYMGVVTAAAAVLSVRFRSLLVAVLGILGGYGTPFMLPGAGDLAGLYAYLLVLGVGVLGVAHRRNWRLLNVLAFLLTSVLLITTVARGGPDATFATVMPFATAYFILFSTVIFIYQVLHGEKSTLLELGFLFLNALVFFGVARHLTLATYPREVLAAISLALAGFYTAHVWTILRRGIEDRGLTVGFSALAAFFLILTLPLLWSDAWLTVSWSVMAMVFLWASGRLGSRFLEAVALGLYGMVAIRFFCLDLPSAFGPPLPGNPDVFAPKLLERLVVFGTPVATLAMALRWVRNPVAPGPHRIGAGNDLPVALARPPLIWMTGGLMFLMSFVFVQLEVARTFGVLYPPLATPLSTLGWVAGALVVFRLYGRTGNGVLRRGWLLLTVLTAGKLLCFDLPDWGVVAERYWYGPTPEVSASLALMRLIGFGGVLGYLLTVVRVFSRREEEADLRSVFGYGALAMLLVYVTLEVNTFLAAVAPGLRAGGVSVTWGLFALSLVLAGLVKRMRPLRIVGLAMFTLVALKVFMIDLARLDPVYKIVAFLVLGGVLIAGAFAYVKFEDRFEPGGEAE